jgi:hypothetical protein
MATFYEIYQNYLQNPYSGVNALPGVNAISGTMGATPISSMSGGNGIGEVSSVSPVGSVSNVGNVGGFGNVDTSAKGIAGLAASGLIGGPFGLAANVVGQMIGMPSVSDVVGRAMGISGFGRTDSDFATAGVFGGDDSSSTGTANATDTGDMGSEAANDAASASAAAGGSGGGGGADSAGDGGDGYAKGGRAGYVEGGISQEGRMSYLYPGLLDGSFNPKNFEEDRALDYSFNQFKPLQFIGASGYPETTYGDEPINLDQLKEFKKQLDQLQLQRGDVPKRYFDKLDQAINIASQATTPTEDFSDYVTKTTPTVAEQIISTNNSSPALTSVAETLFPQGDFLNIRETAASPTEYNIKATEDLVKNLPGFVQPFAPAAAAALSLPYDTIQAYQRMEPGSGIQGFGKAFQAERPLESAFERFTGAAGPLAENINTAISSLNPFQKQQYMNYAVQNPDQAIAAAQRNKDFLAATQKNIAPATTPAPASMAAGGRVFYLQGGLASLLG